MRRRDFIGAAVAAALAARGARANILAGGSAASSSGMTFDYYISASGSSSNPGTLEAPWDLSVLTYGSSKASTIAGKRIGLLGAYLTPASYYTGVVSNAGSNNYGSILGIPSGTQSAPTYIGSSNSSGYEQEGACTLDFHPNATTGQSSVTYGISLQISAIATGSSTVVTLVSSASTNPFASLVGQSVWLDSDSQTDLTGIGLTPPSHGGGAAATLYTISAVGGTSGAWTVTLNTTTSGSYTPAAQASIYWNYVPLLCALIGQTKNGPFAGAGGYWTLKGVNVTGGTQSCVIAVPTAAGLASVNQAAISGIASGSTTTITVSSTASSNPYAAGNLVQLDNIEGSGTLENLNYANGAGSFTVASVGGSSGAWTFTLDVETSGTFTSGTNAYVTSAMPGVTIDSCAIYDGAGWPGAETACVYAETTKGLTVNNCLLHDFNVALGQNGGFLTSSGVECFYSYDMTVSLTTTYNVAAGVWPKSYSMGNITVKGCCLQTITYAGMTQATYPIFAGDGQTLPGFSLTVANNVLIGAVMIGWANTDSQLSNGGFQGQCVFTNNTCYCPVVAGNAETVTGMVFPGGASSSGYVSVSPAAKLTKYNNVWNLAAVGNTLYGGVIWACAGGTTSAPTNNGVAASDYEMADIASGADYAYLSSYDDVSTPLSGGGELTLSAWQSAAALDAHTVLATPSYQGDTLNYTSPQSFKLVAGSAGSASGASPGSTNGTSGGSACDKGAWGGASPPSQIGSTLA